MEDVDVDVLSLMLSSLMKDGLQWMLLLMRTSDVVMMLLFAERKLDV